MIKVSTSDTQEVMAAVQKELEKFSESGFVTVGIHEDGGAHEGGITNAALGALLHYGGGGIPARRFLDLGVESGVKEYLTIIKSVAESEGTLSEALSKIGVTAAFQVQQYMTTLKSPPNSEITIKRKKSSNPLIDTGALRQSIAFKKVLKKPSEGLS